MRAIDRVTRILQVVCAAAPGGINLSELSHLSGLDKSTTFRITRALCESEWLSKSQGDRMFRPGVEAWLAGRSGNDGLNRMTRAAARRLAVVAREVDATVYLAVRSGMDMVIVARADGGAPLRAGLDVGQRQTLAAGALGLAYLSTLEPTECAATVAALRPKRKSVTTGVDELPAAIARARAQGYARSAGSVFYQVRALAFPVMGPDGRALGAVSLATDAERLDAKYIQAVLPLVRQAVNGIQYAIVRSH